MLNPYSIACCVAKSTATFRILLMALAVESAMQGASYCLALTQALGGLLFFTPLLLSPALILLGSDQYAEHGRWRAHFGLRRSEAWFQWCRKTTLRMIVLMCLGLVLSRILSQDSSWKFLRSVYGSRLLLDDLEPNCGLAWYFFVQMFEHFHDFYILVVNTHFWSYMVPITVRYRSDPLFALTLLSGILALFQNYPSLNDTAFFLTLWSLSAGQLAECMSYNLTQDLRYPLVTTLIFIYTALLMPAFYHLWLYAGSANANFFYAINLVYAMGIGGLILDAAWAWGRSAWEKERLRHRPKHKDLTSEEKGKERVVVQR